MQPIILRRKPDANGGVLGFEIITIVDRYTVINENLDTPNKARQVFLAICDGELTEIHEDDLFGETSSDYVATLQS